MKNFMFAFTLAVAAVMFFVGFGRGYDKGQRDGFAAGDRSRARYESCIAEHPYSHGACYPLLYK